MQDEEWRVIPSFPNYQASSLGRIRNIWGGWGRLMTQKWSWGYLAVGLTRNKIQHVVFVHIAVLEAFVGPRPNGLEARHLNGNRSDNTPGNLAWGTRSENGFDRVRHGTHVNNNGEKCGLAKLTNAQAAEIRRRYAAGGVTQSQLAREYGIDQSGVSDIVHYKSYKE